MNEDDISNELCEIGKILASLSFMDSIKKEVRAALDDHNTMVVDGVLSGNSKYEVVVLNCKEQQAEVIARRVRENIPNVEVEKIVDGIVGINRRGE